MNRAEYVTDAADKARWLTNKECRGPGDLRGAMERLSRRYGIPFRTLWSLRYRPPGDLMVSVYVKIVEAYDAELLRQQQLLEHERALTIPRTWMGRLLCRAADQIDGTAAEPLIPAKRKAGGGAA